MHRNIQHGRARAHVLADVTFVALCGMLALGGGILIGLAIVVWG